MRKAYWPDLSRKPTVASVYSKGRMKRYFVLRSLFIAIELADSSIVRLPGAARVERKRL